MYWYTHVLHLSHNKFLLRLFKITQGHKDKVQTASEEDVNKKAEKERKKERTHIKSSGYGRSEKTRRNF